MLFEFTLSTPLDTLFYDAAVKKLSLLIRLFGQDPFAEDENATQIQAEAFFGYPPKFLTGTPLLALC